MSPSLSAHLLEQYSSIRAARAPFGQPLSSAQQLVISGPMSYAPQMHGSSAFQHQQQPLFLDQGSLNMSSEDTSANSFYADISQSTAHKLATLQAKLDQKLGPEYISQRPGPGGGIKLTYAEGWKIINLANEVFGFNGWSSSVVNLNTDFIDFDEVTKKYSIGVSAVIKVTLRDGVYHEDVGYGMLENSKSKGAALDKCKKEAVTDGVKRALRNFGNLLGNCLYDKAYTQEIVKMKVPPTKFDRRSLHRRPEYQENHPTAGKPHSSGSASNADATPQNGHPPPRPPIPRIIPKAIGMNTFPSSQSFNTISNGAGKPPDLPAAQSGPVATSTPMRNSSAQVGPGLGAQKDDADGASIKPQAPVVPQSNRIPSSNSIQINKPSNQTPKEVTVLAVQQTKLKPRPLQELERADTYSIYSEDDADFLAALEKAEGDTVLNELAADIGRPIDDCEGVGGAIDFEADETRTYGVVDMLISPSSSSDDKTLVEKSDNVKGAQQKAPAKDNSGKLIEPALKAANSLPPRQPPPATRAGGGIMQPREISKQSFNSVPLSSAEDEIAKQIVAMRQQRKAASSVRSLNTPTVGSIPDENSRSKGTTSVPQPSLSSKPRAPSMGGFNFPLGMKPSMAPLSSGVRQSPEVTIQAGVKRPAEVMESTVSSSGPISYAKVQATAQAYSARQPFARLDDLDGGNSKRVRR